MQHYIYILKLNAQYKKEETRNEAINEIIGAHFEYLKKHVEEGVAQLVGKTDYKNDHPDNIGMVIFLADNEAAAKEIMNNDPAVKNGIMNAILHPFRLALINKN